MIKLRPTYFLACFLLALCSCSTEEMADKDFGGYDNTITFRPILNSTKAQELTTSNFHQFMVTAFNPYNKSLVSANGSLRPYFENELFEQFEETGEFANLAHPYDYCWPEDGKPLTFIAFSHSPQEMRQRCGLTSEEFLELQNNSRASGTVSLDYKMAKFQVPADIAMQLDFVTAHTKSKKSASAVKLNFKHQLSQIVVKVCGNNPGYSINIAGVCIGQPVEEGTLDFSPSDGNVAWIFPEHTSKGRVSYTYQTGDTIKTLEANKAISEAEAFSIMGNGGPAMVIPTENKKWHGTEDRRLEIENETMYLSVLMRVFGPDDDVIYPFQDDSEMNVVYLAVDENNNVVATVDASDVPLPEGAAQIKSFGWAAVPVDASWTPGKRYVYTLDYSSGVGIQDPLDPEPGEPIIGGDVDMGNVKITVSLTDWAPTSYIDIDVPGTGEQGKNSTK